MVLLCKNKALYVKACVIANGITDKQGDTLYREDIKKIFTTFNNQDNFEVYHNDLPIQEVSLLENYISTADETIGTSIVPSGSWNVVIRVDNPTIQEGLLTGEFGGISLNNRIAPKCSAGLSGQVRYQDISDAECVIPLLISFVERGANGYGLHVMDYDAYIKKSSSFSKGAKRMAFNLLDGLKSLIKEAEASEKEDAVILKEDNMDQKEEVVEEASIKKEAEPTTEEEVNEPVVQKEDTTEKEEDTTPAEEEVKEPVEEEAEIEKADEPSIADLESRITKLEELIQQLLPKEEENDEVDDGAEPTVDEDTPKITKSEKVIVENTKTQENTNFYDMTGRDPITGVKIRNQSKIL